MCKNVQGVLIYRGEGGCTNVCSGNTLQGKSIFKQLSQFLQVLHLAACGWRGSSYSTSIAETRNVFQIIGKICRENFYKPRQNIK